MRSLIIGIIFIIGGLQGELVLRGTESSTGIIVVGGILVLIGLASFFGGSKSVNRA